MIDEGLMLKRAYEQGRADATEWHYPSKGELPDDNEIVLLSIKGRVWKRMEFGQWNGQFFVANDSDYSVSEIRAWMPLPEPPQEEA